MRDALVRVGAAILGGGLIGYAAFTLTHDAMVAAVVAVVGFGVAAYFVKQ